MDAVEDLLHGLFSPEAYSTETSYIVGWLAAWPLALMLFRRVKKLFPQMHLFAVKELRVTLDGDNRFFGGVKQNVEFPFYKCAGS